MPSREEFSREKLKKIEFEENYINGDYVGLIGKTIVDNLTIWVNEEILKTLNLKLNSSIKYFGNPNARCLWSNGEMEIQIGMELIYEIYRDAVTLCLLSEKYYLDKDDLKQLDKDFGVLSPMESGNPILPERLYTELFKIYIGSIENKEIKSNFLSEELYVNATACRFLMFELTLVWVFFHEFSHLIQNHIKIKSMVISNFNLDYIDEIDSTINSNSENISKAFEIYADLEATALIVSYLGQKGYWHTSSIYLLLCGLGCLFQRFYGGYESSLKINKGSHPHPIIRFEFTDTLLGNLVLRILKKNYEDFEETNVKRDLAYTSTRSRLVTGVFWKTRYLENNEELSSFMKLSSIESENDRKIYINTMAENMEYLYSEIITYQLTDNGSLSFIKSLNFLRL